jgi:transposase
MRLTGMSKPTAWRWQARYLDKGVPGRKPDKTRPSRVPPLPSEGLLKVIATTVQETPPNAKHWSRATMAEAAVISPSGVGRIWAEDGLKPHVVKGCKVLNDPMLEAKVTEIVDLCLDPPDRAVVLCVDEKSQIRAPDRTQPGLPLKKGRAATMTHDYKRHGTTTLFAALDVKSGMVISDCMPRHRAKEFLTFLRRIDRAVLKPRDIHIVLDNHATHKTPEVMASLEKHPRFKLHLTPTSTSWMNLVERFFAQITARRMRPGSYASVDDLEAAIYDCLLLHNARPRPFV